MADDRQDRTVLPDVIMAVIDDALERPADTHLRRAIERLSIFEIWALAAAFDRAFTKVFDEHTAAMIKRGASDG